LFAAHQPYAPGGPFSGIVAVVADFRRAFVPSVVPAWSSASCRRLVGSPAVAVAAVALVVFVVAELHADSPMFHPGPARRERAHGGRTVRRVCGG
jgi:hypothetical protein